MQDSDEEHDANENENIDLSAWLQYADAGDEASTLPCPPAEAAALATECLDIAVYDASVHAIALAPEAAVDAATAQSVLCKYEPQIANINSLSTLGKTTTLALSDIAVDPEVCQLQIWRNNWTTMPTHKAIADPIPVARFGANGAAGSLCV